MLPTTVAPKLATVVGIHCCPRKDHPLVYIPQPRNKPDTSPRTPSEFLTEPLLIRLTESVGKLPTGFIYELPRTLALALIHARHATAVGTFGPADITPTEQECIDADLT
jgi:hypothetical protein